MEEMVSGRGMTYCTLADGGRAICHTEKERKKQMAYNLQIIDESLGITANVKYQNLSVPEAGKPDVVAKANNNGVEVEVKERTTYQGQVLGQGATQRQWCDEQGNVYSKSEIKFYIEDEEVAENTKSSQFHVEQYQPVTNYLDKYVISKYYEIYPSDNGAKKDFDRNIAIQSNKAQLYKLWKYLTENDVCARADFCVSSKGFTPSAGYIRAISVDEKWGLEIGLFKELKEFKHLESGEPKAVQESVQAGGKKRLKLAI